MNSKTSLLILLAATVASGCGGDEKDGNGSDSLPEGEQSKPALTVEEIRFSLDEDLLLSELSDGEIQGACEEMAVVFRAADEGVACQVVAASSESSDDACRSAADDCRDEPGEALEQTSIRSTPAPVDCSVFEASLAAGCEFPVSLLEDCVNSLAQSVVPSAEAVSCTEAGDISDLAAAANLATQSKSTDFVEVCEPLLVCTGLIGALLGTGSSGMGGAGGAQN